MSNQINDMPGEYGFGLDFNYEVWTQETKITLTNVPWGNDYKDVYRPDTQAKLDDYINARLNTNVAITNASYAEISQPIKINIPLNRALEYNYVRVENPLSPVPGGDKLRNYYYFILSVNFNAPNTTEIVVELDVYQTFGYEVEFGAVFTERSHMGIAATNRMSESGKEFLNIPEGIDTGATYQIKPMGEIMLGQLGTVDAVLASTISLVTDPGVQSAPKMSSANGSTVNGVGLPVEVYVMRMNDVPTYFSRMKSLAHITRGVYKVTVMPQLDKFMHSADTVSLKPVPKTVVPIWGEYPFGTLRTPLNPGVPRVENVKTNFRDFIKAALPERFRHLDKFLMSPYSVIEITDWNGEPAYFQPENIPTADIILNMLISTVPGAERMATYIKDYGAAAPGLPLASGEYLNSALFTTSFPTLPVVNDGAAIAMASSAYSRAHSVRSNDWAYQKNLAGNQNSFRNSGISQDNANAQAGIGRGADSAQTALGNQTMHQQHLSGAISGIGGGAALGMLGGPVGGAAGAAGGIVSAAASGMSNRIQESHNNASLAIRGASSLESQRASNRANNQISRNNKRLADYAAAGDYQDAVSAINASTRDMALSPPQVSAQIGGELFNLIVNNMKINVRLKLIQNGEINRVGNYWLRYGYALNRYMVPPKDMHCMTKFSYWKLTEAYIVRGNIPEIYRQTIRGIFEKGVTVWKDANDIGAIDMATNQALPDMRIEAQ